jgi:hypothetical protein
MYLGHRQTQLASSTKFRNATLRLGRAHECIKLSQVGILLAVTFGNCKFWMKASVKSRSCTQFIAGGRGAVIVDGLAGKNVGMRKELLERLRITVSRESAGSSTTLVQAFAVLLAFEQQVVQL